MMEARRVRARKRGRGAVRGESVFEYRDAPEAARGLEQVMGEEPTPALACMLAENCRNLLDQLDDESLRSVALFKMEGYSNEQIARELRVTVRTVERKLRRIRARWEQ
jgi:DNA-directed RNA polymerase specialized sigma24 family protein